ncbi:MAG: carbon-nitrogen hydrolase family protein [Propionibacteriales bacterium]|nr:carbon-nitrogen hydrolase family protein [Propionibacteriales bacterium]
MITIALAQLAYPTSADAAVETAVAAIADAAASGAAVVCFPECYLPGYRAAGRGNPRPPTAAWLEAAHARVLEAAAASHIAVVMGTERLVDGAHRITTLVAGPDGTLLGWQDKEQLDPSEDELFTPGSGREVFAIDGLRFGVAICHEGFRYPETVRAVVRAGAQLVFHPHYSWHTDGDWEPGGYAEAGNSFHEGATRSRAAENTCWFAPVNHASAHSPTTSALIDPDGDVVAWQPHGQEGLLVVPLDPRRATGQLAMRRRPVEPG